MTNNPAQHENTIINRAISNGDNVPSGLEELLNRAEALEKSIGFWNNAYIALLVGAAVFGALVIVSQYRVIIKQGALARVRVDIADSRETKLRAELHDKDIALRRELHAKDLAIAGELKDKDVKIGETASIAAAANERAARAANSLALVEQHAADANAKAEGFRRDIAQANERAAEANRIAEQEKLARLQLEARFADRILLPIQEQNLEKAFAGLKGKTVDVAVLGDTMEIAQFSGKLIDCLRRSGVLLNISRPLGGASARGVLVGVRQDAPPEFKQASDAFIAILRQTVDGGVGPWEFDKLVSGGAAMVSNDTGAEPNSPLRIWIGAK